MTYCEYCGEPISYLPFKCKYCSGNFCQKHRLPENHECTFEVRYKPQDEEYLTNLKSKQKTTKSKVLSTDKKSIKLRRYIKRQEKIAKTKQPRTYTWSRNIYGTKILLIMILITSVIASIIYYNGLEEYIYFSLSGIINKFAFYTILTSLFITEISLFSPFLIIEIFFLIIIVFFTYVLAKSIELRFGTYFLFKLFIVASLFSLLFYIPLRLTLISLFPIPLVTISIGFAWGGILGLISYSLFPAMNREITAIMTIIPIKMRGRSFLYLIILFRIIPILFSPLSFVIYLPDLGGILGAYIVYKYQRKHL